MLGKVLGAQVPTPPHPKRVASNTTLVLDKARVNTAAAWLSTTMATGSVVQTPALPLAAVVSTTKLAP